MSNISKEELQKLNDHTNNINMAQLALQNSTLLLELEKAKFENYKLSLFRKYNIEEEMYVDRNTGEIKSMKAEKDE